MSGPGHRKPGHQAQGAGTVHGQKSLSLFQILPEGNQEPLDVYWKNHFSTIGIVGMNEACLNFLGTDITTAEGQALP
jgi:hypothetical protein